MTESMTNSGKKKPKVGQAGAGRVSGQCGLGQRMFRGPVGRWHLSIELEVEGS